MVFREVFWCFYYFLSLFSKCFLPIFVCFQGVFYLFSSMFSACFRRQVVHHGPNRTPMGHLRQILPAERLELLLGGSLEQLVDRGRQHEYRPLLHSQPELPGELALAHFERAHSRQVQGVNRARHASCSAAAHRVGRHDDAERLAVPRPSHPS